MAIKVTFEAMTATNLYQQIVDFIEVSSGASTPNKTTKNKSPAKQMVEAAAATLPEPPKPPSVQAAERKEEGPKYPTPAVLALLKQYGIAEEEWPDVPRTGVNGRMTQGDVKKYVADNFTAKEIAQAEEPEEAQPAAEELEVSEQDLRGLLRELYQAENGRERCFSLLKPYGTVAITEIDPSNYAELYDAIKADLAS